MHPRRPSPVAPEAPLRYAVDPDGRALVIDLLNIDDESDLLASLQGILADPRCRPGLDVYVDCNHLRRIPSTDDVRRLARAIVRVPRATTIRRCALLAAWRPIHDAARFFATVVSAPNIALRVFHTRTDARVWFALTAPEPPEPLPWVGPSPAMNELMRRSRVVGR